MPRALCQAQQDLGLLAASGLLAWTGLGGVSLTSLSSHSSPVLQDCCYFLCAEGETKTLRV